MEKAGTTSLPTVAVDTRALEPDFRAHFGRGTGRYVREVVSRFDNFPKHDFSILNISSEKLSLTPFQKKLSSILPAGKVTFESQCCMNRNLSALNASLAHFFFHGDAPAFPTVPQLLTVLDLIPLKFPALYQKGVGGLRYKFARYLERCAIRSALGIITISEASKKDIIEIIEVPEEHVHVTYLGVDESFFKINALGKKDDPHFLNKTFQIPTGAHTALYIGGIDARKNIPFLLNVVAELNKIESIQKDGGFHLILAGNYTKDDKYPALVSDRKRLELESLVHLSGYVDENTLHRLYQHSDLFIFPSLYEGFGLPVLEAMAAGLVVITGDNSCMPEVVGNAGWKLPDNESGLWVSEVHTLLQEKKNNPAFIKERIEMGIEQARCFTWDKTTKQTLDIYKKYLFALQKRA